MNQADAICGLKANGAEIRRMGIEHLSLFGSTARGNQRPESDVDIAARFRPDFALAAFQFVGIEQKIPALLDANRQISLRL